MDNIITNQEKINIVSAKINAIEIGLEWLSNNSSEGQILEGKMSIEQQISGLTQQKNALLQLLNSLQVNIK